jgi:hypothetical protein
MREQFWLGLTQLWKLLREHLGNLLMVSLPCTDEQGLIGGILDECVLKVIG